MLDNNNNNNNECLLINTLIHYFIRNKSFTRRTTSVRLNPEVQEQFYHTCRRLGLLNRGRTNQALEALMIFLIEETKTVPPIIQTTLIGDSDRKRVLSLPQRLKIVSIKREFGNILDAYDKNIGHETWREGRFRELLGRAITIYEETRDPALKKMLEKAEQVFEVKK